MFNDKKIRTLSLSIIVGALQIIGGSFIRGIKLE